MKKLQVFEVILASLALSLLIDLLFGRFLSASLSTLPLLNRWKLLSPQTPIVINTKEEVRVSDTGDVLQALSQAQSKVSAVFTVNGTQVSLAGAALNLTSDGLFLTVKSLVENVKPENLDLKLDDGTLVRVSKIVADPATDLAVLVGQTSNLSTANLGSSKDLSLGEKLIALSGSWLNFSPGFMNLYVSGDQKSNYDGLSAAGFPARSFVLQNQSQLPLGSALFNLSGEAVGLTDAKGAIISGDVIKDFVGKYLAGAGVFQRPSFGFKYRNISEAESQILNEAFGVKVMSVDSGGPAQKAGLTSGDIISRVDGSALTKDLSLEELLQNYKPGDKIQLTVWRNKQNLVLSIISGGL